MRAIIVLALVGTVLAGPMSGSRIAGGSDTSVEQYPFMVAMQFGMYGSGFAQNCGGSLITENAILSAAHCYVMLSISWWRACPGTSHRSSCPTAHVISSITIHEGFYSVLLDADLAIVRLQIPVAVNMITTGLARIAGLNYNLPDGTSITALGWGATTYEGSASEQLQHVDVDIINQQLCAERYAYLKTQPDYSNWPDITDGMLCVGILDVGGKSVCQGDSGGPVVHNGDIVVGVSSWTYGCADAFYPGVLARVSYYSDWIVANAS